MKMICQTQWRGDKLAAKLAESLDSSVQESLDHLLGRSNDNAPEKSGDLKRSGRVNKMGPGEGEVVYDSEYARVQHERLDFHHDRGGAKFLEKAMIEESRTIFNMMANQVRELL